MNMFSFGRHDEGRMMVKMWRCSFYLPKDQDGYEHQCMLYNVGGCRGDLDLRPAVCPLKIDESEQRYDEFRIGVKKYLDLTDNLIEVLTDEHKKLSDNLDATIEMCVVLNTKLNILAVDKGLVCHDDISPIKNGVH